MTLLQVAAHAPKALSFEGLKKEFSKKYSKHLSFKEADACIASMYKDRLGQHNKSGKMLFEFFKKMIKRKDVLENEAVRSLCEAAYKTLNSKRLSQGPAVGMPEANKRYEGLLKKVAPVVVKERREAIFDQLKEHLGRDVDKLALDYLEVDPKVHQEIEAALRNAQGEVNDELQIKLMGLGTRFGDLIESFDLHDVPLNREKLEIIASVFPNLKKLNVNNCGLDGACIKVLAEKFRKLESLEMNSNPNIAFNQIDLSQNPFPALRELSINNCGLNDSALSVIPVGIFQNVERLSVRDHLFCQPMVYLVSPFFPNIRQLDLRGCLFISDFKKAQVRQQSPGLEVL